MITHTFTLEVTRSEESQQALQDLAGKERERTLLVSSVAHEMASPLSALRIQLKVLAARIEHTALVDASLRILHANLDQLLLLTQDLADAARLQGHHLKLQPRPLDLAKLIPAALDDFRPNLGTCSVDWDACLDGPLPVNADPQRVTQVLHNLLSNAAKHAPGSTIRIQACKADGQAVVRVEDAGRGLRQDEIDRLFEPFSQVRQPGERKTGGSGLGLYVAKGIVEGHGGRIWATSPGLGQGSTFAFSLPEAR